VGLALGVTMTVQRSMGNEVTPATGGRLNDTALMGGSAPRAGGGGTDRLAPGQPPSRAWRAVNRFPRGRTFARRMEILESVLRGLELEGKTVLDLGCGSGSLTACRLTRPACTDRHRARMLDWRATRPRAGLGDRVEFEGDVLTARSRQT
jgi:hypothetical protein